MKCHLILPAMLLLAACSADPVQQLADARQAVAAQDYDRARVLLTATLQDQPANREALNLLVQTYLRLGDGDAAQGAVARLRATGASGSDLARFEAEAALLRGLPKKALELLGDDATTDGWRIRAAALLDGGKPDEALDAFRKGLTAGDDPRLSQDYTRYLLDSGDFDGAAEQLAKLEQARPVPLSVVMLKGDLLIARQQFALALAAYRQAAQGNSRRIEPLLGQATSLSMLGRKPEALAAIAAADKLKPGDGRIVAMQVQLAAETGDWKLVRQALQPIEGSLAPMSVENLTYAEALLNLGQAEQARARFARAHLVAPRNPYARLMLAACLMETGDAAGALEKVRPLADSALAGPRELSLAESAARAAGDMALADRFKLRLSEVSNGAREKSVAAADAAFARGDFAAASAAYRQLPGFAQDAEVLRRLALASSKLGQHGEALALAGQALALQPDNPAMQHVAGLVRLNGGKDLAQAVALLEAAVAAEPGNRAFRRDLAKAKAAAG
jgi:tetratricopeptide (TPR) repeat protein